jgi:hypothetical protein
MSRIARMGVEIGRFWQDHLGQNDFLEPVELIDFDHGSSVSMVLSKMVLSKMTALGAMSATTRTFVAALQAANRFPTTNQPGGLGWGIVGPLALKRPNSFSPNEIQSQIARMSVGIGRFWQDYLGQNDFPLALKKPNS